MTNIDAFDKKLLVSNRLKKILIIVACFIAAIMAVVFLLLPHKEDVEHTTSKTIALDAASAALNTDELWRNKLAENIDNKEIEVNKKIDEIKTELTNALKEVDSSKDTEVKNLKEKLAFIEAEMNESKTSDDLKLDVASIPRITRYVVPLTNAKNSRDYSPIKTPDNYIAAGSFAKAILLSGLDVSTSIKVASDPEPVLIRITDYGNLPRKFKSDLKDCHIIGSSYGDLSSERAKIRIEKLSCTEVKTSEVIETEVAGYVAGEDGRAGLRGIVVSVDQKYLINAQIFGTLSGIAGSETKDPTVYNPFTIGQGAVKPLSTKNNIGNNLLQGGSNSLDKLADYYIDKAESVQPVIEISAGREVDVIFTEGVYFGTSNLKTSISKKRDDRIRNKSENESSLINQLEQ